MPESRCHHQLPTPLRMMGGVLCLVSCCILQNKLILAILDKGTRHKTQDTRIYVDELGGTNGLHTRQLRNQNAPDHPDHFCLEFPTISTVFVLPKEITGLYSSCSDGRRNPYISCVVCASLIQTASCVRIQPSFFLHFACYWLRSRSARASLPAASRPRAQLHKPSIRPTFHPYKRPSC